MRLASTIIKFSDPYLCIISTSRNSNYIRLMPFCHVCKLLKYTTLYTVYAGMFMNSLHTKFHMHCSSDNNYCCHIKSYYRSCTATIILYLQKVTTNAAIFSKTFYHTKIQVFYISRSRSVSLWGAHMASMLTLFICSSQNKQTRYNSALHCIKCHSSISHATGFWSCNVRINDVVR
jgi:hypothetical protein